MQLVPADYVCSGYTHWLLLIIGETGPLNYSVNVLKWTCTGQTLLLSQGQNTQKKKSMHGILYITTGAVKKQYKYKKHFVPYGITNL